MNSIRQGFTLLELLIVMAIMVILMTIAVASYGGIRRGAEIRGAVMALRTTLMLARQDAVTKKKSVTVQFVRGATAASPDSINVVSARFGQLTTNSVVPLPMGVQLTNNLTAITFTPSGSVVGTGWQEIKIIERAGASGGAVQGSRTVRVWFLTGITKEM
jgi:prepilin-type N-terminal cleavage/methylation domain-containing protein